MTLTISQMVIKVAKQHSEPVYKKMLKDGDDFRLAFIKKLSGKRSTMSDHTPQQESLDTLGEQK